MKIIYILLLCLFINWVTVHADDTFSTPISIADIQLNKAIDEINSDTGHLQSIDREISDLQSQRNTIQTDLIQTEQSVTIVASQTPPLQSAVNYCNSNPTNCVNWTVNP